MIEFETEYKSPLILKRLLISDCRFRRSEDSLKDVKVKLLFKHEIEILPENDDTGTNERKVSLEVSMSDKAKKLELSVKCVAYFETLNEDNSFIQKNGLAIMFPYVRSYISNITVQPGMSPIVLPPLNIAAMFQDN
ncbi:MAG: protein-export chaperone SecB [Synergistaceae bacterium]|nr:protein-export chaperone SecB [Synergistaceae bacterium]